MTSLAEGDQIFDGFEAVAAAGRPAAFAYGTELRWDTAFQQLAAVVAAGAVGEVQSVVAAGVGDCVNHGSHVSVRTSLVTQGLTEAPWAE